jgi:hypothetical protein
MTTKLNAPFKRELELNGEKFTVTFSPEGLKIVPKGHRNGVELAWSAILGGDAALATALNASLTPGRPALESMPRRAQTKH